MLETVGLDAEVARTAAPWAAAGDASLGRVAWVDRGLMSVLTEDGPCRASFGGALLSRVALDPSEAPCAGDWCLLREWPGGCRTVERVLPRRTALARTVSGAQTRGQVLCSNMDIVALVVALHPLPAGGRLERLVALGRETGARPLVVLSKCDLVTDAAAATDDIVAAAPGVEVTRVSARTGEGVRALRDRLEGRLTLALLGAAGEGKTSLTKALVGADVLAPREHGRGGPASVRRELVALPTGGAVIDAPDLRFVGPVHAQTSAPGRGSSWATGR